MSGQARCGGATILLWLWPAILPWPTDSCCRVLGWIWWICCLRFLMWAAMMVTSGSNDSMPAMVSTNEDLYEGYNDFDPQILVYGDMKSCKNVIGMAVGGNPNLSHSQASSMSENQGGKSETFTIRTPTPHTTSMWRPPSVDRTTRAPSMTTILHGEVSRPMTAVRAAGYSSRGSKFDPLNQASRSLTPAQPTKKEINPEYQCREMERLVNQVLEESASASFSGDHRTALDKAKEASKKERLLCKLREHASLTDQMNWELTLAVCFNLGYQYHANGLLSEALGTYSHIIKNKQFTQGGRLRVNMGNIYYEQKKFTLAVKMYRMALDQTSNIYKETRYRIMRNIGNALMQLGQYQDAIQSYEAVIEIKVDHQSCYNLIVCYYILGHIDKARSVFTKMLIVKHYDFDSDEDMSGGGYNVVPWNDALREELRSRQKQAFKYILIAARLIAPMLGSTFSEGYDYLIEMLKDQEYIALANEMEMDRAMQFLRRWDFGHAVSLLKDFEKKEKDLKARAATNLSFVYFLEGDIVNAEKHAELAVKTDPYNACALVNHGNCFFSRGDIPGAIALYREAIEVEADCVEAIYNIGLSHKNNNCLADALNTFQKLNNLLPNNVEVSFQVGHLNEMMGNYQQAIQWLEIVNTRVMHDAGVLAMLGSLHAKIDDEPKALHYYSESHRVYPANMDITSWLGAFFVRNELYEKAMPYFELAFKVQPTKVKWQLMVASCYRRTGQYKLALAKYKAILAKHPENVECLRYLVHMCNSLGRKEELVHYESRLRLATCQAIQKQHSRLESTGSSYSNTQQQDMYPRKNHEWRTQESMHIETVFSPALVSQLSTSSVPQNPQQRVVVERKFNRNEEWPELGDELLPM